MLCAKCNINEAYVLVCDQCNMADDRASLQNDIKMIRENIADCVGELKSEFIKLLADAIQSLNKLNRSR